MTTSTTTITFDQLKLKKKKSDKILQRDCLYNITEHRQIA